MSLFIEIRKNQQLTTTDVVTIDEHNDYEKDTSIEEDLNADANGHFVMETNRESTQILCETLNHLLGLCGNKNKKWVTYNYRELIGRTRLNYLLRARSIIKSIISIMAPNDANQLEHDLFDHHNDKDIVKIDDHFLLIMQSVSEVYKNTAWWTMRREILSIIASQISFKLIQCFVSGLSRDRFTAARKHAAEFGHGASIDQSAAVIQRLDA